MIVSASKHQLEILGTLQMGVHQLDVQRQADYNEFLKKAEELLKDVKELRDELVKLTKE